MSALRPLPWRWRLPALAAGLLLGESAAAAGGRWPWRIVVGAALMAPLVARRSRRAGLGAGLAGMAAVAGLLLAWGRGARGWPTGDGGAQRLIATVADVQPLDGYGGAVGASLALDVERVVEGNGRVREGDRVRLRAWIAQREWVPGERVSARVEARRPRGRCNGGRDAVAESASRARLDWFAEAGDDRSIEKLGFAPGLRVALARARRRIAAAIEESADPHAAPVVRSIVVGDAHGLDPELRDAYARTGTSHVLSVSGLHVAIVASTSTWLLRVVLGCSLRLAVACAPLRIAAALSLLPTLAYVALAGAAVPALRSLASCSAILGAIVVRRRSDPWPAMAA
ncbi:MAG: ComEC/Rec2 family competence protein, partial [Alphaproteobacteria bacterium]